ncbi:MAG: DUF1573 domain-containing protein [Patescibacteria group bacterium]
MKQHEQKDNSTVWVIIITSVLTVIIVAGISWVGKVGKDNKINLLTSQLQAVESSYDFGSISMANGKVTKIFSIMNNTAQSITVKKLYTSCMCTKATLIKEGESFGPFGMPAHGFIPEVNTNIESNQEAQVEVVFDPAAHGPAGVGPIGREVILETSDGKITLSFKANVMP